MKQMRFASTVVAVCISISACANPEILKVFKEVYSKPNANCQQCHTKPPQRNPYGKALEAALDKAQVSEVTAQIFKSIESADSDGDGSTNGDEIAADTMPGDATSKPVSIESPSKKNEPAGQELVPKHSFHPAIVHFPIALLAVAALFEVLAKRKSNDLYHKVSILNLIIGVLSGAGAILTGVVAWLRLGFRLEGNLLIHLIIASLSVLVGVGAYVHREKPSYMPLIVVSGILVLVAGHFGGTMIY